MTTRTMDHTYLINLDGGSAILPVTGKVELPDKFLVVRNHEQKIILFCEMLGQISDGQWENSGPWEHYVPWMLDADQIIVDPSKEPGRNFDAVKSNYNLASSELLNVVADRMLMKVKLFRLLGEKILPVLYSDHWAIPEDLAEYDNIVRRASGDEYYSKRLAKLNAIGIDKEIITKAELLPTYKMPDLRRDIAELRKAMKTRIFGLTNRTAVEPKASRKPRKIVEMLPTGWVRESKTAIVRSNFGRKVVVDITENLMEVSVIDGRRGLIAKDFENTVGLVSGEKAAEYGNEFLAKVVGKLTAKK